MDNTWNNIASKKLSSYFKLYACQIMFETFFMVAHRNYVSIYDLSEEEWTHYVYEDTVRHIGLTTRAGKYLYAND